MARVTERSAFVDGILDVLAVGAIVSTALVAPNVAQVVAKLYEKRADKQSRERYARATLQYMKRQGVVKIVEADGQYTIDITDKGRRRIARRQLEALAIPEPAEWDGRWRLVMFDIPEGHRRIRQVLTAKLQAMGFRLLQRSAWVHPFPCSEQIKILCDAYPEITPHVLCADVTQINAEAKLKKLFAKQLPSTNYK